MEENPRAEEVKEHFTLRKLQERVWRLESENKELKVSNSILQTQYTSQCEQQSEILRTLHANLEENYEAIEKQQKEIQRLEQLLDDQKQEFKDKLEEENAQWRNHVSSLQQQNEDLEKKLNEVREFQRNKETMEGELAALKKALQDQAEAHARDVSAFDRKKAIDIDQLKKDMQLRIKETREMLKARTKDQLDSTTKRTMMENEQMFTELHFQSKETERLLDRNRQLLEENSQLRRNLHIHKDLENELARRTHVYQRLLKKMDQKQKAEQVAQDQSRQLNASVSEIGQLTEERSLGASQELGGVPSEEHTKLQRQLEEQQSTLQIVRHEFAQYRRDHSTLTQLQDQSTRLIISALYELKNQKEQNPFPPATYDPDADWQFANMTVRQKEYFFRVLLEKLNGSMCATCLPSGPNAASTTSLPAIGKSQEHSKEGNNFSQFLWSVATHGGVPATQGPMSQRKEVATKSAQTETVNADPCLKEGLWNPKSKMGHKNSSGNVTPSMVVGNVRNWGAKPAARQRGL
eukprot:TRINITY_DN17233_c0_g1_i1.p1 TRINITY_DN17233_c0_g1~~TRINITY_DN17233_c0_g1_i1.p1  ORF type:complete len:521 (-),score=123.11 TRINITY_DN17233_c0_g1_i1:306-1868(-)